ncbi:centromere/kinetochore protein zw10 homolog isoform X2 [Oncorhynchus tshawytscha]|uniref:centromere/kinetochore protein zw10 homolog isoform X2 n=1 Tax=Oncorhynchus tshawytscha TaxID=74940 RepID=UPI000D09B88C|nr:centromere/kinetochore protein zw10 homolog isoform X2 [Oncorhynchus tshawytscha]
MFSKSNMASFVTEVLASSGKLEKEDLAAKISKLSRKVEETKEEVCDMINKRYNEFLPSMQGAEVLMGQAEEVSKEIDVLKSCIETEVQQNLHTAVTEYAKLKQQLERNTTVIAMLRHLEEFHIAMEEFHKALLEKKYVIAAKQLEKARHSADSLKAWKGSDLPLLRALSSELTVQRENLIYHLGDEWKRMTVWKLPPSKEPTEMKSFLKTELQLTLGGTKEPGQSPPPLLSCVLQALTIQGELQHKIKLFSQVLLKYLLKPLITYPSLNVEVSEQQDEGTLISLQFAETPEEHSSPSQVYTKVLMVLKTLHTHLLDVSVGERKVSVILGDLVWQDMSHCIIHECLLYSIPTNSCQLEQYSAVIKETEEFEKSLKEMQYLRGDSTELLKYAQDVNCHFASKKCKDVIVAARKLMTSEMHNTVKITQDSKLSVPMLPNPGSGDIKGKQGAKKLEAPRLDNEKQLGARTLCLPVCRISESVQQLMELALHTLSEAVGNSSQCATQLFFTVRNIFQLFYDVVPTYHKENLLKFPHLAAIQHNNCMYIAHHLLTLGHQFSPHLPDPLSEGAATFVDLVPGFRKLGAHCFLAHLNVQRAEMLERLSTARNFSNLDDEDNYSAASKAVRQVIHQLKRLGTVWQDVLPVNIYCKAMGILLNTAISELIAKIMMLEDISTEDGEHLQILCQTIIEEGPPVFIPLPEENKNKKYQEEVPVYVKKWITFKELVIVLQANLQEIVDRWAEGKGPLALEFSSSDMKSLIRALFQNTERRAVALTKIK